MPPTLAAWRHPHHNGIKGRDSVPVLMAQPTEAERRTMIDRYQPPEYFKRAYYLMAICLELSDNDSTAGVYLDNSARALLDSLYPASKTLLTADYTPENLPDILEAYTLLWMMKLSADAALRSYSMETSFDMIHEAMHDIEKFDLLTIKMGCTPCQVNTPKT